MLSRYLKDAIYDIDCLIKLTKQDIKNIKETKNEKVLVKHEKVFSNMKAKNELIVSFGAKKALLDNELVLLVKENPDKNLADIISKEDGNLLEEMKISLQELHTLNKEYAKFVVVMSEFYNSLIDTIFPGETNGYSKTTSKPATFLKVRV